MVEAEISARQTHTSLSSFSREPASGERRGRGDTWIPERVTLNGEEPLRFLPSSNVAYMNSAGLVPTFGSGRRSNIIVVAPGIFLSSWVVVQFSARPKHTRDRQNSRQKRRNRKTRRAIRRNDLNRIQFAA